MRIPGNGTNGGRFETARTIALPDTGDGDTGTQEGLDHMDQRAGCPTGCIRANVYWFPGSAPEHVPTSWPHIRAPSPRPSRSPDAERCRPTVVRSAQAYVGWGRTSANSGLFGSGLTDSRTHRPTPR